MMILRMILYVLVFVFFFVLTYILWDQKRLQGKLLREESKRWLILAIVLTAILLVFLLAYDALWGLPKAFVLGVILVVPLCCWGKWWVRKHIDGSRFCCSRGDRLSCALSSSLTFTLLLLVLDLTGGIDGVSKILWIFAGFPLSWVVAQAYILNRVIELENKLGESIIQEVR